MPLNIKDEETYTLARRLSALTGKSLTRTVHDALAEKLERVARQAPPEAVAGELDRIARACAALPLLDARTADEILGYDDSGLPA